MPGRTPTEKRKVPTSIQRLLDLYGQVDPLTGLPVRASTLVAEVSRLSQQRTGQPVGTAPGPLSVQSVGTAPGPTVVMPGIPSPGRERVRTQQQALREALGIGRGTSRAQLAAELSGAGRGVSRAAAQAAEFGAGRGTTRAEGLSAFREALKRRERQGRGTSRAQANAFGRLF